MLVVTDQVLRALNDALSSRDTDTDDCFRLTTKEGGGLGFAITAPAADDKTFEYHGGTVLAVPPDLETTVANRTLDFGDEGKLVLK